jgi:hypothetical protein
MKKEFKLLFVLPSQLSPFVQSHPEIENLLWHLFIGQKTTQRVNVQVDITVDEKPPF